MLDSFIFVFDAFYAFFDELWLTFSACQRGAAMVGGTDEPGAGVRAVAGTARAAGRHARAAPHTHTAARRVI